jgi:HEAT repeat protein
MTLILLLLWQDVGALIRQLGADDPAAREEASRRLRAIGAPAAAALREAASTGDLETAARARSILHLFAVRESLTPNLLSAMPGVDERLAAGDDAVWTEVLMEAVAEEGGKRKHPKIRVQDLEVLAPRAARGWKPAGEGRAFEDVLARCGLKSAVPVLIERSKDPDRDVRHGIMYTLAGLETPEARRALVPMLDDTDESIRAMTALCMSYLGTREVAPKLTELLKDSSFLVRGFAAEALARIIHERNQSGTRIAT